MEQDQALQIILAEVPETGEVYHAEVDAKLYSTPEGRQARRYFNKLRRDGAFKVRVDREKGDLLISRVTAGV